MKRRYLVIRHRTNPSMLMLVCYILSSIEKTLLLNISQQSLSGMVMELSTVKMRSIFTYNTTTTLTKNIISVHIWVKIFVGRSLFMYGHVGPFDMCRQLFADIYINCWCIEMCSMVQSQIKWNSRCQRKPMDCVHITVTFDHLDYLLKIDYN